MGESVGGKSPEVSRVFWKDPLVNLEHFDTNLMGAVDCGYMVSAEKPAKNGFYGAKNCVGWHEIE